MTHLNEEQLVNAYYGEADGDTRVHVEECEQCRALFDRIKEDLDALRDYPVPERGADYGREIWVRLLPRLGAQARTPGWLRWWVLTPAAVAVLAIAFTGGIFVEKQRAETVPSVATERVLLMSLSDHLQRAELELTEVMNGQDGAAEWRDERARARDLIAENRLLRESAMRNGDVRDAALLDELERVLLEISNGPADASREDLDELRRRIQQDGLLFKVRVTSTDARKKGQEL